MKGGGNNIVLSFDDDAIAATVAVGLDVEMILEGPISGVDYIDVIQDKTGGSGKGKSNLKNKDTAPGQNKGSGQSAGVIIDGRDTAPGQNKDSGNNGNGKGKDTAPGQNT